MQRRPKFTAVIALAAVALMIAPIAALAGEAEAKDAAKNASCTPGRVETLRNTPGPTGSVVFKVACTGPGMRDAFVRVECRQRTCTVLN